MICKTPTTVHALTIHDMTCHATRNIRFRWTHELMSAGAGGWVVPDDGARPGQVASGARRQCDRHWWPGHRHTQVSHYHLLTSLPTPSSHALPGNSLTPSLTHSLTHSLTCLLASLLNHSFAHSLDHSFAHSLAQSFAHSLTHSLPHSLTHSLNCTHSTALLQLPSLNCNADTALLTPHC